MASRENYRQMHQEHELGIVMSSTMSKRPVPLLQEKSFAPMTMVWQKIRQVVLENNLAKLLLLILNIRGHWALSHAMTMAGLPKKAEFYKSMRFRYLRTYYLGGRFPIPARLVV